MRTLASIRFDLTRFQESDLPPGALPENSPIRRALLTEGVPKAFLIDTIIADPHVTTVALPDTRPLLRFATDIDGTPICVEPISGHVVQVDTFEDPEHPHLMFVNESLAQFNETTRRLTEAYPFEIVEEDGSTNPDEALLRSIIDSVDHRALTTPVDGSQSYWWTFLGNVAIDQYDQVNFLDTPGTAPADNEPQ